MLNEYPRDGYHSLYILFNAKDMIANIFASIAASGQVGYISLDATFLIYVVNGTLIFLAASLGDPKWTTMFVGIVG